MSDHPNVLDQPIAHATGSPADGDAMLYDSATKLLRTGRQAHINDMNLGSLVLIGDVITALGTIQTSYNALLDRLEAAGINATS